MREFIISTESNADLPGEFILENDICVIPHYYSIEDEIYGEDKELSIKEFYDAMRAGKKAGTMASNPVVIEEKFTSLVEAGKDILHISFSSALSGGCSNVVMMSQEIMEKHPEAKILVLDTLSASVGEMIMIMKALELKKQGKGLDETRDIIVGLIPHICAHFTVDDLNHLYRGGRLSKTSAIVGSLMDVKPILHINAEGGLVALSKTRGRKKSMNVLVNNVSDRLGEWKDKQIAIGILHGDCEEEALYLKQLIIDKLGYDKFLVRPVGPSIGAHSGPGLLGVVFLGEYR